MFAMLSVTANHPEYSEALCVLSGSVSIYRTLPRLMGQPRLLHLATPTQLLLQNALKRYSIVYYCILHQSLYSM
jgi:hypothetical protein